MSDNENIHGKLDIVVRLCKDNIKLCSGFANYLSNVSFNTGKELDNLKKTTDEIKDEVIKLNILREMEKHVYSDKEIYKLKKVMSWNKLHQKTDIPVSTLQYRYRRYMKFIGCLDDNEDPEKFNEKS